MTLRLEGHGLLARSATVTVLVDGMPVSAHAGETLATVFAAAGTAVLRATRFAGAPRGLYCGIGYCHDCLVTVDGRENRRACMTIVADGMKVATQAARQDVPRGGARNPTSHEES
jgi:predicted molibdopterin-dependent oxidoreductase YjgC